MPSERPDCGEGQLLRMAVIAGFFAFFLNESAGFLFNSWAVFFIVTVSVAVILIRSRRQRIAQLVIQQRLLELEKGLLSLSATEKRKRETFYE